MKLKVIGLLLFMVLMVNVVYSQEVEITESCYVEIGILEEKVGEDIQFSLEGVGNLYGVHAGLVDVYDSEIGSNYILNVYSSGSLIEQYSLYSSRFVIAEDFDAGTGEVIESDSGVINSVIPYDSSIGNIKVENEGVETDLGNIAGQVSCTRTCKIEGEGGSYSNDDYCCSGFNTIQTGDDSFVCADVGDGVCSADEDYFTSEDCADVCPEEFGVGCSFVKCGDNVCDDYELFESYCALDCPLTLVDIQGYIGDWLSGSLSFERALKVVDNYVNL